MKCSIARRSMGGCLGMYPTRWSAKISLASSTAPWLWAIARRTNALFSSPVLTSTVMVTPPLSRRGGCRDDADLLQQAELIPGIPVFNPLTRVVEPGDNHHADVHRLPG